MDFSIGFLRRRASTWLGEQEPRPLAVCPTCESDLVQPQGWKELPSGDLLLSLRCPECQEVTSGTFAQERVAEFDDGLIKGKDALLTGYQALVRHNMEELLEHFRQALELDLISAGDFELAPVGRGTPRDRLDGRALRVESP